MHKKLFTAILITLCIVFLPLTTLAQSDGIPLQKDVFLEYPITTAEDFPDQITFNLYDSETAITPIATQTFPKGEYTVEFEFSKSDGRTSGTVARINANFTNKLNISDDPDASTRIKEIWVGIEVAGTEVGDRTQVADETLVQLLLASDASIATYLTLVYEGDDNPITTIYRDLPLSFLSSDGSESSLNSYFSALSGMPDNTRGGNVNWVDIGGGGSRILGSVGIGTSTPDRKLHIHNTSPGVFTKWTDSTTGTNWNDGFMMGYSASADFKNFENTDMGFYTNGLPRILIKNDGNVGIGTNNPGTYTLAVEGTIGCRELTVTTVAWADFVFEDHYRLPSLIEVEQFISENKHLPGIPTESEVKEKGVSVGNISSKLLQKIEELTLYVIKLNKENELLKAELADIKIQISNGSK